MCNFTYPTIMEYITDIIDRAFSGIPYPGRENVCGSPSGRWEFEPLFECEDQWCKDWRRIPAELIAQEVRDILPLFSDAGYKFFIPAFMKAALLAIKYPFNGDYSTLLMYVVYSLCPSEDFKEQHISRISQFNDKQKRAIAVFLEYVQQHDTEEDYNEMITTTLEKSMYCPCPPSAHEANMPNGTPKNNDESPAD